MEALEALKIVKKALNSARLKQINYNQKWSLLIFSINYTPTALSLAGGNIRMDTLALYSVKDDS